MQGHANTATEALEGGNTHRQPFTCSTADARLCWFRPPEETPPSLPLPLLLLTAAEEAPGAGAAGLVLARAGRSACVQQAVGGQGSCGTQSGSRVALPF